MATPVWFVQEAGRLLVQTDANSGKVKRIRRNPHVLVAPCTATGRLLADPVPARAELLGDAEVGWVERLLAAKYRIDLLVIRPIRSLQAALQRRRSPSQADHPGDHPHMSEPATSTTRPAAAGFRPNRQPTMRRSRGGSCNGPINQPTHPTTSQTRQGAG